MPSDGPSAPLLCFREVTRRRLDGGGRVVPVLKSVSFELAAGVAMGLYGERRCGKSTLLRLAAGLEAPDEGAVLFEGQSLAGVSNRERARLLGGPIALLATSMTPMAARETVMDHIAIGAGSAGLSLRKARQRALNALEACGLPAACAQENVSTLAPAEWARVALARALVREPRLLLVDELAPLAGLIERDRLCALLRALARERGIALLLASEDMGALQGVSVLASLSAGELCSSEASATVLQFPSARLGAGERA